MTTIITMYDTISWLYRWVSALTTLQTLIISHTRLGVVNFVKVGGTPSVVAVICIGVAIFLYIKYVVKVIKKTFRISSLTDWTRGKTTKRRGRLLRTL